jgi:hypothetical protein
VPQLYLPKRQFGYEESVQERIRPGVNAARKRHIEIDVEALRRKAKDYVVSGMVKSAEARGVQLELRSPKRKAERDFINGLQVAFYNITGVEPAITAREYEHADGTIAPSPFVLMVQRCLDRMGAEEVSTIEQINALRRLASHRKEKKPLK